MEIYDEIAAEYEKIRSRNDTAHKKLMQKVYTTSPRIKEIDDACADICRDYCQKVVSGSMQPDMAADKMQREINALTAEKEALLAKMGLTIKALERTYICPKCKDKGYVNGKRCKCYYEKQSLALLKASNLNPEAGHTFRDFDLSLYSDKEDTRYGFSPRDNANSVKEIAMCFAAEKENAPQNLFLYGATGLGKTFTSDCIAHEYIRRRKSVFYISAPKLFTVYEDYKFGRADGSTAESTISSVQNCELLILDDLGAEFHSPFTDSCLFEIVNSRLSNRKKMIISSNLSPKELSKNYSDRIASRIIGEFEQLLFIGDDIRIKRLYQ